MGGKDRLAQFLDIVTTISVGVAAIAFTSTMFVNRATALRSSRPATREGAASTFQDFAEVVRDETLRLPVQRVSSVSMGRPVLVEFSDFECPFCGRYARETLPAMKREFVDTQKIDYVFVSFPLETIHKKAFAAAKAAVCGRRLGAFWGIHERLFANHGQFGSTAISDFAHALNLNEQHFGACLAEVDTEVREEMAEGRRLGVNSTPTFFLGRVEAAGVVSLHRRIRGAVPYAMFKATIDRFLSQAAN